MTTRMRGLARRSLVGTAIVLPLLGMAIASATAGDSADVAALADAVARGRAALAPQAWQRPFPASGEPGPAEAAYWLANAAAKRGDWDAAFAAIAAGARRRDTWPALPWTTGDARQLTDDALAQVAEHFRSRFDAHCAAGRLDEAVALVQATLTFGVDLTHRPFPVEWSVGGQVVGACVEAIESRLLPLCEAAQCRTLAALAANVDAWADPALDAHPVQLFYAQRIVDGDEHVIGWTHRAWVPLWRGTAQRGAAAAKLEYLAAIEQLATTATLPWPPREAALRRADEGMEAWERAWRQHLTRLRLLRLRLAFLLHEAPPELQDPLGSGPIRQQIAGDEATFTATGAACRVVRTPAEPGRAVPLRR